jgi:hypothetical protein
MRNAVVSMGAAIMLLMAATTHAGVTYTSQAAFTSALNAGFYSQNFQSLPNNSGLSTPANFAGGAGNAITYQASTSAQAFLVFDFSGNQYLTTATTFGTGWSAPITITFTGAPVNAIGGSFFLTSISGSIVGDAFSVSFSDGSSHSLSGQTNTTFFGYVSDTPITSVTISPPATHRFVSIDNLIVGSAVPTPGGAGVFGGMMLVGMRRRR